MVMHAAAALPLEPTARIILNELPGTSYRVRKSLLIEVERDDAGFVVSEPTTGVFHYDPNWSVALEGFVRVFINEFEFLQRNEHELSARLSAELECFRQLIEPLR